MSLIHLTPFLILFLLLDTFPSQCGTGIANLLPGMWPVPSDALVGGNSTYWLAIRQMPNDLVIGSAPILVQGLVLFGPVFFIHSCTIDNIIELLQPTSGLDVPVGHTLPLELKCNPTDLE